jgi:hypothetical protein
VVILLLGFKHTSPLLLRRAGLRTKDGVASKAQLPQERTLRVRAMEHGTVVSRLALLGVTLLLTGCPRSTTVQVTTNEQSPGMQSETAAASFLFFFQPRIVVAYNDDSDNQATLQYTPVNRTILRGASLMGWSFSEDEGATWKRGGKLQPPPGWAVLWGDPAVAGTSWPLGAVYMSNLAFPDTKFPAGGYSGGVDGSVAGGACVFKSTDGGATFNLFHCITDQSSAPGVANSSKGHFYDGGSLATRFYNDVIAAYVDIDTSQIVVYDSENGAPFSMLPPPFPGLYIASHPRLRVGPDGTLFVMAIAKSSGANQYTVVASRFANGTWSAPTLVAGAVVYPTVPLGSDLLGSPLTLRTGPQFAYDVGTRSIGLVDDSVRFLVTQQNSSGWLFIRGGICDYFLTKCGTFAGWTFGSDTSPPQRAQRLDVFNPDVVASASQFITFQPTWQGSYLGRYGDSTQTVSLYRAPLGFLSGQPLSFPAAISKDQPVCSDLRGYWGDYDAHIIAHFDWNNPRFTRFMTNSGQGCTQRWQFEGKTQHVQAISYQ